MLPLQETDARQTADVGSRMRAWRWLILPERARVAVEEWRREIPPSESLCGCDMRPPMRQSIRVAMVDSANESLRGRCNVLMSLASGFSLRAVDLSWKAGGRTATVYEAKDRRSTVKRTAPTTDWSAGNFVSVGSPTDVFKSFVGGGWTTVGPPTTVGHRLCQYRPPIEKFSESRKQIEIFAECKSKFPACVFGIRSVVVVGRGEMLQLGQLFKVWSKDKSKEEKGSLDTLIRLLEVKQPSSVKKDTKKELSLETSMLILKMASNYDGGLLRELKIA
eukprot:Gb_36809 [translate_table: standard]